MTEVLTSTNTHGLSREQLLDVDYYLRLARTLEERLVALFRQAKVIGGLYRSLGFSPVLRSAQAYSRETPSVVAD